MTIFGTNNVIHRSRKITFLAIVFLIFPFFTWAQTDRFCNDNSCGDLEPNWELSGLTVVCEGDNFKLSSSSSRPLNQIQSYHWFIEDLQTNEVIFDTLFNDTTLLTYNFALSDSLACQLTNARVSLQVRLVVQSQSCGDGLQSCRFVTKPLTVFLKPRANFRVDPDICIGEDINLQNTGCHGEDFFWDFGDGTTSTEENPVKIYETPGTYNIRLRSTNNCGVDEAIRTVSVVGTPDAEFSIENIPNNFCLPLSISFKNNSNEFSNTVWEIIPNAPDQWMFTDSTMNFFSRDIEVQFLQTGNFTIRLRAFNLCMEEDIAEEEITLFDPPEIQLEDALLFCDQATISSADLDFQITGDFEEVNWFFENASVNNLNGNTFSGVEFTESGRVIVEVQGPCVTTRDTSEIIIETTELITLDPNNPEEWCQDAGLLQLNASPDNGRWQGPGGITTSGSVNPENLPPGRHLFIYNAGSADCPNTDSLEILIRAPAFVDLNPIDPICETLSFTPNVRYSGEIDTYSWTFPGGNPSQSNLSNPENINFSRPDTFLVTIEVEGVCGIKKDSIPVLIQAKPRLFIQEVNQPICDNANPIQLTANENGGRWLGNGINQTSGIFDPSAVAPNQNYIIQYEYQNGACLDTTSTDLQVVAASEVSAQGTTLCIDNPPAALLASPAGGFWSGVPAINATTGIFDPQVSGAGIFEVNYTFTDTNQCTVSSRTNVNVEALPIIQTNGRTIEVCLSDFTTSIPGILEYTVLPATGQDTWVGEGIVDSLEGLFNPVASGLDTGTYQITVTRKTAFCSISDTYQVNVIPIPELNISLDTTICIDENTLQLFSSISGGRWAGSGIDQNGQIDLEIPGGGSFTYVYFLNEGTSCAQMTSTQVTIIDLASRIDTGPLQSVCQGPSTVQLTGVSPANGFWRGPSILNEQTGLIDLTQLRPDSMYTFQYCLESSEIDNCIACKPKNFILRSNPVANFSIPQDARCINQVFAVENLSIGGQNYNWDFGNGNTSTNFEPNNSYDRSDNYIIKLEAISEFGCQDTTSQALYISQPPRVLFSLLDTQGCAPFQIEVNNQSSGDSIQQQWVIGLDTILGASLDNYFIDSVTENTALQVRLEVENFCGVVTAVDSVLVRPYPTVNFGISEDEGCSPLEIDLINTTLGNADEYLWDLGNGESTDFEPPNPIYFANNDTIERYAIQLIAANECGIDTLVKNITVLPPDVEAFIELDTLEGCLPLSFQLKSQSTPGSEVSWRFLDPNGVENGSQLMDPIVNLNTPGLHTLLLYASSCGTDSDTAQVNVLPAPEVRFSHRPFICVGQQITFENESAEISGSIWDFGDGQSSTERSPQHQFQAPGRYTVQLTVFSAINNCPSTLTSEIEVIENPIVQFTSDKTQGCGPLDINFTNLTEHSAALEFIWDFGDGSSQVFTSDPSHRFEHPGNYQVTLTAYSADSCFADTSLLNIFVFPDPVSEFQFTSAVNCANKDSLNILNLSQNSVAYTWNIGGLIYEDSLPKVFLDQTGDIPIELIVQNSFQCRDTSQQILSVLPSPEAAFTVESSVGCKDLSVLFQQQSNNADRYLWDFNNGSSSTDAQPRMLFQEEGVFNVELIALNSNNCPADTANLEIEVLPKPNAAFSFEKPAICGTPTEVIFTNESADNQDNFWNFGDGTSSDETSPNYFYVDFGPKTVELVVSNTLGCRDTSTQTVDIFGLPEADFSFSTGNACTFDSIQLINTSTEAIDYIWQIADRPPITEFSPRIVYNRADNYSVQLIAIYNELCQDTIQKDLLVHQKPIADFSYQADFDPSVIGEVRFTNQSVSANRYVWNLGDGTITDDINVYHEYLVNRSIDVELIAFNDNSGVSTCSDTIVKPVEPEWLATFYAPNALAPDLDNDGVRFFKPVGTGLKIYKIQIYSPWGTIVWQSEALDNGQPSGQWDGTYNGQKLPQGAYVWVATMTFDDGNEQRKSGTVTIIR